MNLIKDLWIPVERRDGTKETISPTQLTSKFSKNPLIRIAAARPDFNAMYTQFLIGLVQTFMAPGSDKKWEELFKTPPSEKELIEKLESKNFSMEHFMQDIHPEEMATKFSVSSLLFESPGEVTVKEGRDLFQREGTVKTLCSACTAIALYTKQTCNTMKGVGYRTPSRGGTRSPMATLIKGDTLWETVWLNVLNKKDFYALGGDPKGTIFPWTERTVDSTDKSTVSLDEKHPAYPFWEMPLRYQVLFEETDDTCDICGASEKKMVTHLRAKNYGNNGRMPRHTLSPYMMGETGVMFRGCSYPYSNTDYLSFMGYLVPSENKYPAAVVTNFLTKRKISGLKLWCAGYQCEKAKYDGWEEKIRLIPDIEGKEEFIVKLINTAGKVAWLTEYYTKRMQVSRKAMAKCNIVTLRNEFSRVTEPDFYAALEDGNVESWLSNIVKKALQLFDKYMDDQKIGLQYFFKGKIIEELNKTIAENFDVPPLENKDFIKFSSSHKSYKAPRFFEKETRSTLLSWWKKQEMVTKKHAFFSRCVSAKEVMASVYFDELVDLLSPTFTKINSEKVKERLAVGLIIASKVDTVDLSDSFIAQLLINEINERRISELLRIKDVVTNWKMFDGVVKQLDSVNIISFLECITNWCPEIKDHWKRVSTIH